MTLPNLQSVGGTFTATGIDCSLGFPAPNIRKIGGDLVLRHTKLAHLPKYLEHIGGNAIISPSEPKSLFQELIQAQKSGLLKGKIICLDDDGNEVPFGKNSA